MQIEPFAEHHWDDVKEIYRQGLEGRNATFEVDVPHFSLWYKKFNPALLWVMVEDGRVLAWAGLQPTSVRKAYEGVMEVTVYVHNKEAGKGIGTALMKHLIRESENAGVWTLYASIFPENVSSIRLHLRHGFREIGYRERIAKLDGKWRNTVLFERRSIINGL